MSYGYPQQKWTLSASSAPAVTDDRPHGYEPLSLWLKQDSSGIYICTSNAPGAAAWQLVGSSSTTGTVTSVGISGPSIISWANSPVTTSGTLTGTLVNQSANQVLAGPTTGSAATPAFRALVAADIPTIAESQVTNLVTDLASANAVAGVALFDHYADANNGTTVETDLYSDTLTAALFAANGQKVYWRNAGIFVGDATSTQRLRAYFGGTLVFDSGALGIGVTTTYWDLEVTIIRVSASVVRVSATLNTSFASLAAYAIYTEVTGLTLANTQVVKITGQAAGVTGGSNQITAKLGYARWIKAA